MSRFYKTSENAKLCPLKFPQNWEKSTAGAKLFPTPYEKLKKTQARNSYDPVTGDSIGEVSPHVPLASSVQTFC